MSLTGQKIRVSLGYSSATYEKGIEALSIGACSLTHVFNSTSPLHNRSPGLAGLIASPKQAPFYSLIPDGVNIHPAMVNMGYRANPQKCILVTDSIKPSGLADRSYPGRARTQQSQAEVGNKEVTEGIGTLPVGDFRLDEGIRNLVKWSGRNIAEAVRCVTENVVSLMGIKDRGNLEEGRRADLVVLNEEGKVLQTWTGGRKVWDMEDS